MEESKKRKYLLITGPLILFIALIGVTYAFFNYTRTGANNTIRVGRISFNSSQNGVIDLTNVFPISSQEALTDTINAKSIAITITGDTDYVDGVEYLVTASDVNLTVGGKNMPVTLEISVAGNNSKTLGTVETGDYYANRENYQVSKYKIEYNGEIKEGSHLLVGYIVPNTTSGTAEGIGGIINIKAYIDSNRVKISDTYDGTESDNMGTTNEWVGEKVVFTTQEWNSIQSSQTPLSFKVKVEANEGIWVEEPLTAYTQIIKNVITPENPINFANESSSSNGEGLYILPGTENNTNPIYYYRGAVTNNNVIFGDYCWQIVRTTDTGGIKMIYNGAVTGNGQTCENTTHASRVLTGTSAFNSQNNSASDVGYMKNARYPLVSGAPVSGAYLGTSVEYGEYDTNNPGTNVYRLVDDGNGSVGTTLDANHHYTCNETTASGTCTQLRYYFYNNFYINLTGGELVEDAIYKMTGNIVNPNIDVVTRNQGYVLNNTDSTIKSSIESWFRTNLTNEVDNTKRNYVSFLEDTVYCNDRSIRDLGGWNPNGGALTKYLYFISINRNWYSTTNVPSTTCPNETDRFSVSSNVAHLNYPVGLLTFDEIIMAGARGRSYADNTSYYLYTGNYYWSMSPYVFYNNYAYGYYMGNRGSLDVTDISNPRNIRPVVSLELGTEFETGGDGSTTNPYVVKYE